MIYAAIVAGGTGSRMGADIPKQFLPLGGKAVLIRTAERFLDSGKIDAVYIGVHPDWTEQLAEMCREHIRDTSKIRVIEGGSDRNSTVLRIVDSIRGERGISDDDIIITHDGVRPFVTVREIEDSITALDGYDGVTVCAPVKDTILCSEDGRGIMSVPDRDKLFRTLTPQTFRLSVLSDAFERLPHETVSRLTDTAGLLRELGKPVGLVPGSEYNIKLTTPIDMALGELILKQSNNNNK
jgi:2-C-methyl-D-erythritol 4-phosphate cytidylyltransferase